MNDNLSTVNTGSVATTRTPEMIAAEIRALTGSVLSGILEIGRRFTEAKELLPHGAFGDWVRGQTGYSMSTANNFMRLYSEYGADQGSLFGASANSQTFGNLSYSKALALLEVPAEERESFAREVGAEELSVRELKEAIRERDERLEEAENTAEGYRQKLQYSEQTVSKKNDELAQAETELENLRGQLEELMNAPKEVAVQTVVDEGAVQKAAQEAREKAEKELKAKIAKAERERDKALAEQEKALKAQKAAEQKLEAEKLDRDSSETAAKKALEISNAQLADLQKKLAQYGAPTRPAAWGEDEQSQRLRATNGSPRLSGSREDVSPEKVSFKFWFEQGQACVNNMLDCVGKLRNAGKGEDADKLANALRVFLEQALLYSGKVGE